MKAKVSATLVLAAIACPLAFVAAVGLKGRSLEEQEGTASPQNVATKLVINGQAMVDSFASDVGRIVDQFEQWKKKKVTQHRTEINSVIATWEKEMESTHSYCEHLISNEDPNAHAKCNIKKEVFNTKKDADLLNLKMKLSDSFSLSVDKYVIDLTALRLQGETDKVHIHHFLKKLDLLEAQNAGEDFNDKQISLKNQLTSMDNVIRKVQEEINDKKSIIFGEICVEFGGIDHIVPIYDQDDFMDKFAEAAEIAYAAAGLEMDVISVSILDQHIENETQSIPEPRKLRMKVGTAYQCFCGTDGIKSDVGHWRALSEFPGYHPLHNIPAEESDGRRLWLLWSALKGVLHSGHLFSGSQWSLTSPGTASTEDPWSSDVMTIFRDALQTSMEGVFQSMDSVDVISCTEMDSKKADAKLERTTRLEQMAINENHARKSIEQAEVMMEEYIKMISEEKAKFKLQQSKKVDHLVQIAKSLDRWQNETDLTEDYCIEVKAIKPLAMAKELCRAKKAKLGRDKFADLLQLKRTFSRDFNDAADLYESEINKLIAAGDADRASMQTNLDNLKTWSEEYRDLDPLFYEPARKEMEFLLESLTEISNKLSSELANVRRVVLGRICLEFTGARHEVKTDKMDYFDDRLAVSLELALSQSGVMADVLQTDILAQDFGTADNLLVEVGAVFESESTVLWGKSEDEVDIAEVLGSMFALALSQNINDLFESAVPATTIHCSTMDIFGSKD